MDGPILIGETAALMKAIIRERYGRPSVLDCREVEKPVPEDDEGLVRVHASSVNPLEWYGVTGPYFARFDNGLRRPKQARVGSDVAGRGEGVGRDGEDRPPDDDAVGSAVGG